MAEPLQITPSDEPGTLRLVGELDISTAGTAWNAFHLALSDGRPLTIDMSGLRFMDSSGLRVLLKAAEAAAAKGTNVVLLRPSVQVQKLLKLTIPKGIPGVEVVG
jgi:anti-sigma B factor antagonist